MIYISVFVDHFKMYLAVTEFTDISIFDLESNETNTPNYN